MRAHFADVSVQSCRMVQDGIYLQEPDITSLWFITLMKLNDEISQTNELMSRCLHFTCNQQLRKYDFQCGSLVGEWLIP